MHSRKQILENQKKFKKEIVDSLKVEFKQAKRELAKIETKDNADRNSASVIARKQTLTMPRQCATSVIARQSPRAWPKQYAASVIARQLAKARSKQSTC